MSGCSRGRRDGLRNRSGAVRLSVASPLAALMNVKMWRFKEVARMALSEMLQARVHNRIHD